MSAIAVVAAVVLAIGGARAVAHSGGDFAGFTVMVAGTPTAGTPFNVTIQAYDADHDGDANYSGTRCVRFSGPASSPSGKAPTYPAGSASCSGSVVSFSSSFKAIVPITLYAAGSGVKLTVTDVPTSKSGSATFTVAPAALDHFSFVIPSGLVAGTPFSATVSAFDLYGNAPSGWVSAAQCVTFSGAGTIGSYSPKYPDQGPCASGSSQLSFDGLGHAPAPITLFKAESGMLAMTGGGKSVSTAYTVSPSTLLPSFVAQPTDAQISTPITSDVVTHAPVTVAVADQYGNKAPDSTAVQMSTTAALGGTTSQPTSGGVATFANLTLAATGTYKLTAAVGAATALSNPFEIVLQQAVCSSASCQVTASNSAQTSSTNASSGSGTPFQNLVLQTTFDSSAPPAGACNGFTPLAGTTGTSVEVTGGNITDSQPSLRITLTVTKATLKAAGLNILQALTLNVCLGAKRYDGATDKPWIGRLGVPATYDSGTGLYWGLVPELAIWGWPNPNPYIAARYFDSSGNLVIVVVKPYPWDGRAYV